MPGGARPSGYHGWCEIEVTIRPSARWRLTGRIVVVLIERPFCGRPRDSPALPGPQYLWASPPRGANLDLSVLGALAGGRALKAEPRALLKPDHPQ